MRSFEALIDDINKNKEIANSSMENLDPRTLTTKIGHIKRAKQNLSDLFLEYRKEVMNRAVFILAKGANADSFIEIAKAEYGCFSVNGDALYEDIISRIDKRYFENQSSSPALFDLLMSSFNDVCDDVGIVGYPAVLFENKYRRRLKTKEDLLSLTKEAFNDKVGSDLVGYYAIDRASREAVNSSYNGKTIPIIISSEDKDLLSELGKTLKNITANVFEISTTKKQTQESVEQKLLKIKEQIK